MIDLKAQFGDRYRIAWEEPATSTGGVPEAERHLYCRVPCRYGHIGLWGDDQPYAFTDRRLMRSRLVSIPGARLLQEGDAEVNVAFPIEQFEAVADLLRARRRRVLSPEARARLVEMGAPHRLKPRGTDSDPESRRGD